ncbi:hypothetical protein [Metabacillus sp. FJAT-52054]|uniref:Apea-like HEPN domain-containing protein n=1 Tax=Metabacillus sediminis TaxID=3117746 RepID=A0ABZ2NEH0_9BACI
MNVFEGLVNKIKSVNWEFEIKEFQNVDNKWLFFKVPKEREGEELSISEKNINIDVITNTNFEKFRLIKGFEGIWSKDLKCIECEIETGAPFTRNLLTVLHKLLAEDNIEKPINDVDEIQIQENELDEENESNISKVRVYISNNIEVYFGYCSKEFSIFSSLKSMMPLERMMNRVITLQIKGINVNSHEEALQYLLKISNSLFFQFSHYLYFPMKLRNERLNRRDRLKHRMKTDEVQASLSNSVILKYEYDNEPMSLYIHGRNSSDLPLNQFLSFYQTIEYYFPIYSNIEAKQKIKRLLKDPLFDPNNDTKLTKILSIVQANRSGEIGDERSQLKATVKNCVEDIDLREFILDNDERKEYFEKNNGKKLSACTINAKGKSNDIINEVCERIYDIRCRIVHKKANGYEGELILPYSPEIKQIIHDINLVEFVAQKVLIDNSSPFTTP